MLNSNESKTTPELYCSLSLRHCFLWTLNSLQEIRSKFVFQLIIGFDVYNYHLKKNIAAMSSGYIVGVSAVLTSFHGRALSAVAVTHMTHWLQVTQLILKDTLILILFFVKKLSCHWRRLGQPIRRKRPHAIIKTDINNTNKWKLTLIFKLQSMCSTT